MTDKHSADEAPGSFGEWRRNEGANVYREFRDGERNLTSCMEAAWEAKQAADVKAVEDYAADRGNYSAGMNETFNAGVTATCDEIKRRITGETE